MKLADWQRQNNVGDSALGNMCRPKIHRTKIYLYRLRLSSPRADKIAAIEKATDGQVTARDLTRLPNGHRSPHKVAHS